MGYIQPSDFINLGKVNEYVAICKNKAYNQALEDLLNRCIEKDNCYVSIQQIRDSVKELEK